MNPCWRSEQGSWGCSGDISLLATRRFTYSRSTQAHRIRRSRNQRDTARGCLASEKACDQLNFTSDEIFRAYRFLPSPLRTIYQDLTERTQCASVSGELCLLGILADTSLSFLLEGPLTFRPDEPADP